MPQVKQYIIELEKAEMNHLAHNLLHAVGWDWHKRLFGSETRIVESNIDEAWAACLMVSEGVPLRKSQVFALIDFAGNLFTFNAIRYSEMGPGESKAVCGKQNDLTMSIAKSILKQLQAQGARGRKEKVYAQDSE